MGINPEITLRPHQVNAIAHILYGGNTLLAHVVGGGIFAALPLRKHPCGDKKDFETKNRKWFCGRIATGDYDAIIIGHSQFEKIPVSVERQRYLLEQQRWEILDGIAELKASHSR